MVAKAAQASLDHEQLLSLVNSMTDAVIAVDNEQLITMYNGATLNLLDINSNLRGEKLSAVLTLNDLEDKAIDLHKLIKSIKTSFVSRNIKLVYPNGEVSNIYISISPVHLSKGLELTKAYVLLMRDITKEKSLEQERDEFVSVVSHELRTPVTIAEGNISNAIELLSQVKHIPEIVNKSLLDAHKQVVFLAKMINDLATLSRAERGSLSMDIEHVNVRDLISELILTFQKQAEEKGLFINQHFDSDLTLITTNRLYLKEILQNILDNAIKYTDHGSITIQSKKKGSSVVFSISDTGHGIAKTDKAKIFTKFYRSEDYRTKSKSGTGLGLYITNKLASLIKATISLESEIDQGSTFSIYVPDLDSHID